MTKPQIPFILASTSPRRRRLLRGRVPRFRVVDSGVKEPPPRAGEPPHRYVVRLARRKAGAVARRVGTGLVLGADTVVVHRGRVLGKPRGRAGARRMLAALAGRWHRVYTGLALAARPGRRVWTAVARTDVKMKKLTERDLTRWSRANHDKAGAYAAQARHNPFVECFRGNFDNVVGLPRRELDVLLGRARRAGRHPA